MQRGGQVLYAGPLGHHSQKLIDYFQAVEGVPKIKEGINPSTWMLEITTPASEQRIGVNFVENYKKSSLYQWVKSHQIGLWNGSPLKQVSVYGRIYFELNFMLIVYIYRGANNNTR